ncbi:WXG100 family type VII secretion target [Labedaea rhizosphaerae]|uniref:ESAT-6-like protein n=1 Tax=Labedaea rhizosphaerae TaxID=598644 RepID=A0A4R6SL46_LABRH|nr:WXG100 family type VII secretion target [Labedaea rhizosphaerae]TDQ04918.1 WXG100 family type VII secretion target [Labedaea rhizosphaerae]
MANGQVQLDTQHMLQVAQQAANSVESIKGHAQTLKNGIDYVLSSWQGQTGDGYRTAMQGQSAMLDQLVRKLDEVSGHVRAGGQGFDSQDTTGRQKTEAMSNQFLSGNLNS